MDHENKPGPNRTVLIIVAAVIVLFLVFVLFVPQSFWVGLSMKLFQ